ncbi:MAG TPA: hypothetical protein VE871_12690 [Longimicrobium sp.]|nr:hypothetical protein [Longimicrobium sp.]
MTTSGGTRVTLLYETQFERGAGTEEFVYRIRGGKAGLVRWKVNSPVFLQDAADSAARRTVSPPSSAAAGNGTGG